MSDAVEDASGDVTEESEKTYEELLGEVGLDLVGGQAIPSTKLKGKEKGKVDITDLEKQLQDLKQ